MCFIFLFTNSDVLCFLIIEKLLRRVTPSRVIPLNYGRMWLFLRRDFMQDLVTKDVLQRGFYVWFYMCFQLYKDGLHHGFMSEILYTFIMNIHTLFAFEFLSNIRNDLVVVFVVYIMTLNVISKESGYLEKVVIYCRTGTCTKLYETCQCE